MNTSTARWRVQVFGALTARQGDRLLTRFSTYKTGALCAYLACHSQKSHPREMLLELFWPDAPPSAARNSLSAALSALRRQFEPAGTPAGTVIQADRGTVRFNPDMLIVDAVEFQAAAQAALDVARGVPASHDALEAAVRLYGGELLPGYYEDWVGAERERLADLYLSLLNALIQHLADAHAFERALTYAHKAIETDPLREASHRTLMRLYTTNGRPVAALEHFRQLEHLLKQSLDVTPARATQDLARDIAGRLGQSRTPAPAASAPQLPMPLTRFFGREEERQGLRDLLRTPDVRLVTLCGLGGIGKSRLAQTVAEDLWPEFKGRVWFVPLADVSQPGRILDAVREAMCLSRGSHAPWDQVTQALAQAPSLLVLDNMEHLAQDGAALIQTLLERLPALTCLVTSREPLWIAGEREWELAPLPIPPGGADWEQVAAATSVCLFADRSQARRVDFAVTPDNFLAVADLCRALEGIPLALELAAGWTRVLAPAQILARLSERFDLLVSRQPDLPVRHRTLRAALDGSVRLLTPDLQRFFSHLSVFRGGWTADAADAVCADSPDGTLDSLRRLQERSLVVAEDAGGEMRFRMLETLREFAGEQREAGDREDADRRHAAYFLGLAQQARESLTGAGQVAWLQRLERERENLRAAWEWGLREDAELSLQIADALWRFWQIRGEFAEGRRWLEEALRRYEARTPAPRSLLRAHALNSLGQLVIRQGEWERARAVYTESLALFRAAGDQVSVAALLNNLGLIALNQDQSAQALPLFTECLALKRMLGDEAILSSTLNNLGQTAMGLGDWARAEAYFEESLTLARKFGQTWGEALLLANLGDVALIRGDQSGALTRHRESLILRRALGDKEGLADSLSAVSHVLVLQGRYEPAARLAASAAALIVEIAASVTPSAVERAGRDHRELEQILGAQAFRRFWEAGGRRSLDASVAEGLAEIGPP